MINLIPPAIKEEMKFARWNTSLIRYIAVVALVAILLGASFAGTFIYLKRKVSSIDQSLVEKQLKIDSYESVVKAASELNERVAAIKIIQKNQPKFSLLLEDIAKFSLKGTSITSIALTGDDKKSVQVSATTNGYVAGVSLRDALASSPRVNAADIVSVSNTNVVIVIGFKPGQAR